MEPEHYLTSRRHGLERMTGVSSIGNSALSECTGDQFSLTGMACRVFRMIAI